MTSPTTRSDEVRHRLWRWIISSPPRFEGVHINTFASSMADAQELQTVKRRDVKE